MCAAVRLVPAGTDDELVALIVLGVLAESVTWPDAIACFTLPSFQRRLMRTCWSETSSTGVPVISPFLKARPIVNGARAWPAGDVKVNDATAGPDGGGGGGGVAVVFTVRAKFVVRVSAPAEPFTVIVYVPAGVKTELETVNVEEHAGLQDAVEREPLAPAGRPDSDNDAGCVEPESRLAVTELVVDDPCVTDLFPPLLREKSNDG